MWRYLREEAKDAGKTDLKEEEKLRCRNAILVCVALLCPLTAGMGTIVLLVWDRYGNEMPGFMANAAYLYPVCAIAGLLLSLLFHKEEYYTLAAVVAMAPILIAFGFFGVWIHWGIG